jgi:hypothetical protein
VRAGQSTDEHLVDHLVLPDHGLVQPVADLTNTIGELGNPRCASRSDGSVVKPSAGEGSAAAATHGSLSIESRCVDITSSLEWIELHAGACREQHVVTWRAPR